MPTAQQADEVRALTQAYILETDAVSPEIMAGFSLPPTSWLNSRLARSGRAWRVGSVAGSHFWVTAARSE